MPDLIYATAPDGVRLPVIDVTNPAFAVPPEAEWQAAKAQYFRQEQSRSWLSRKLILLMLRLFARQSKLIQAVAASRGGYMTGLSTYVLKLGAPNLVPPYSSDIDRRVADSVPATSLRIRLATITELYAAALVPALEASRAPLHLIDIAGGPAACPLNTLLRLAAVRPDLLAGRTIEIADYDIDSSGPAFAQNALAALKDGPLKGLDITLRHVPGGWHELEKLEALLASIPPGDIVTVSSEGGLFDYGSDAEIVAVLQLLCRHTNMVLGSVTTSDDATRQIFRSGAKVIPRGLEAFGRLAGDGGWRIGRSLPAPFSDQVLLTRS